MSLAAETREIEVDWKGPIAAAISKAVEDSRGRDDYGRFQSVSGDSDVLTAEVDVLAPPDVLDAAEDALIEHPDSAIDGDLPHDPDMFRVVGIDIAVGESSSVTIEVWD